MKPSFLIFISSAIRVYDYPRIKDFVHTTEFKDVPDHSGKPLGERYVYLGRELTIEEFNAAAALVFDPNFPGEDRTFQPLALDPAAEEKREAAREAAAAEAKAAAKAAANAAKAEEESVEAARIAALDKIRADAETEADEREKARLSKLAVAAHVKKLDEENAAKAKAVAVTPAAPIARPAPAAPAQSGSPAEAATSTPAFTLDGKNILLAGERIGGLFGDDQQLRVTSAHIHHEPAITAWLQTLAQPA